MSKTLNVATLLMSLVFLLGEIARRGMSYFSVNATTMFEDLFCGALLLLAAVLSFKASRKAKPMMVAAWAYAFGGMFVPFFAHYEAFSKGVQIRADHPIDDVGSIVLKGIIWSLCGLFFLVSLKQANKSSAD